MKVDQVEIDRIKSEIAVSKVKVDKKSLTFSEKLDEYPIIQFILAVLFAVFLFVYFSKQTSFNLSLDVLNLLFLVLGLIVFSFLAASVINIFIPSAGGLWAIQGHIMLEAAQKLGANEAAVIVGMGWGDSWASQIQPFWALPLLAIAGLDVNDIMGYCFMVLLLSGVLITGTLLIM